jgi:hypothetical protein
VRSASGQLPVKLAAFVRQFVYRGDKRAVTGPREVVHGERESFLGGYGWQRSGLGVGSPGLNVAGGGS